MKPFLLNSPCRHHRRTIFPAPFRHIVTALLLILTLSCTGQAEISQEERESTYEQLELFANVLSILQEYYVEEINSQEIIEGAINGLLLSLDPHSSYLKADSFKELQNETQGSFSGIGIEITIRGGILTIISPIEGTPADKAGLKANDIIIKIDDKPTKEMTPEQAVQKLRGPKGSEVTISVHRDGWEELKDFKIIRDVIPLHSVKSFFLEPGFAYTRITTFQSHTTKDYKEALRALMKEQPIKGLILDLRNNPGGLLNQAVSISDVFLDDGLIVYTKGRTKEQNMSFSANENGIDSEFPLVVLVNEGSASASEIVAGALQDHKRAVIIGSRTFGKGSVQTLVPLPDGAGIRMTTARYYTPLGRSIQATGITPDIEIPFIAPRSDKENAKQTTSLREVDLKNYFLNTSEKKQADEAQPAKTETAEEKKTRLKTEERLRQDNQLRSALNILKSLNLFSEFRAR